MKTLDSIRFVLVGTTHPGNIGAAARAMKTMGILNLHLVEPLHYPSAEATARASGADDILASAVVHDNLQSAIEGCHQVYGMSARLRHLTVPIVDPRQAVKQIQQHHDGAQVAIVFGREHSGLSNDELDRCQKLINIPANEAYSSLNLAAAVQVFAYELKMSFNPEIKVGRVGEDREAIDAKDLEHLYIHFEESLMAIGFLEPQNPKNLMRRLRRLFNRADLDRNELQILHGILRAAEKSKGEPE
tara:strand:- start:832 stop:1566 length:735 start_codon:yes stop_codon:yes gene_type:complete